MFVRICTPPTPPSLTSPQADVMTKTEGVTELRKRERERERAACLTEYWYIPVVVSSWRHWPATQYKHLEKDTKENDFSSQNQYYIMAVLLSSGESTKDSYRVTQGHISVRVSRNKNTLTYSKFSFQHHSCWSVGLSHEKLRWGDLKRRSTCRESLLQPPNTCRPEQKQWEDHADLF